MMLKAFALLDMKTGAFATPFFMHHVGLAVRAVTDLAQDLNTTVGRHPGDFALVEIGSFDDNSGVLMACTPINHGLALGFIPQRQQAPLEEFLDRDHAITPERRRSGPVANGELEG